MGLNARPDMDPRYLIQARRPLALFETLTIQVVRPNSESMGNDYSPWTNTFDNPSTTVWTGKAQVQVFRQTLNTFMPLGSITQLRSIRFTISDRSAPWNIRKGDQVRIIESAQNTDLSHYQFTITSAITGDQAFTHDYEAEADMGVTIVDQLVGVGGYGSGQFGAVGYGV